MAYNPRNLYLFTLEEFNQLPYGTVLYTSMGNIYKKGVDALDLETWGGHTIYGVYDPLNHPLKELFLTFMLKTEY